MVGLAVLTKFVIDIGDTFPVKVTNDAEDTQYVSFCKDDACTSFRTAR
jgi:hypothetical protein